MQVHKDQVQEMRRRHLASTIELQYQQLQSLHEMRTDHLNKHHASEWDNQLSYGRKADRELKKKHVLELKEHPKSLRVSLMISLKLYAGRAHDVVLISGEIVACNLLYCSAILF